MSSSLPALKPRKVIQTLKRAGFFIHHTTGSHYFLKRPDNATLPRHRQHRPACIWCRVHHLVRREPPAADPVAVC